MKIVINKEKCNKDSILWEKKYLLKSTNKYFYGELSNKEDWEMIYLEDIEKMYYEKLKESEDKEGLDFTREDLKNMQVWELRYFINWWDIPQLLKRIKKSTPSKENDYELINFLWGNDEEPKYWKLEWIFNNCSMKRSTKKAFYRTVLYREYRYQLFKMSISKDIITHEYLLEKEKLHKKMMSLYLSSNYKENEIFWVTLEKLESMDYSNIKVKWIMRKLCWWCSWDFKYMKVWDIWYYQDDSYPFLVRKIKESPSLDRYDDVIETYCYWDWINYPWYTIWWPKKFMCWSYNELKRVTQKYFFLHVLACEYENRINTLWILTNKTEEDIKKLKEYKRKYDLYYFRDYWMSYDYFESNHIERCMKLENINLEELEKMNFWELDILYDYWTNYDLKDLERMKIWELKYFEYKREPLLLKRIKNKSISISDDFEVLVYKNGIYDPIKCFRIWNLIIQNKLYPIPLKAFYKLVLYYEYEFQKNKLLNIPELTEKDLLKIVELEKKQNKLSKPYLLRCTHYNIYDI